LRFAALATDVLHIESLASADAETMWSLVDYSTMSNAAQVGQIPSPDPNFWFDVNASWYDLFGGVGTTDVASQVVDSAATEASINAQSSNPWWPTMHN
jgi:hypothetical protein